MNTRYAVFVDSVVDGTVPAIREGDRPVVFATEREAQREIADNVLTRVQEFLDGERDFEDALTVEEYVAEVRVLPDGSIVDASGRSFR
jgi:hypothetical protein